MAVKLENRIRLLYIRDIFAEETDVHHKITLEQLRAKLNARVGETVDVTAASLRRDIECLTDAHFTITGEQEKNGMAKLYYHEERLFETYELRMLADAVCAAQFISESDAKGLLGKMKQLTSKHYAKKLQNALILEGRRPSIHPHIRYDVDVLHEAVAERNVIEFRYGQYNVDLQWELRREGAYYRVWPLDLVWHNQFYYLIAVYEETMEVRHYRVDRMRELRSLNEHFTYEQFKRNDYLHKTFLMYTGEETMAQLQFTNDMTNVVVDRFGRDVHVLAKTSTHFTIKTKVHESEGLVKWILEQGAKVKVIKPESLREQVAMEIKAMMALYK